MCLAGSQDGGLDGGGLYLFPFHHLLLLSWEPIKFTFYGSGSVKAQAPQEDVDKMMGKGALELV